MAAIRIPVDDVKHSMAINLVLVNKCAACNIAATIERLRVCVCLLGRGDVSGNAFHDLMFNAECSEYVSI